LRWVNAAAPRDEDDEGMPFASHPDSAAWRFHRLFLAPHRLAFASGALLLCVSSLWWAGVNLAAWLGLPVAWSLPAPVVHSVVMTFGFMPFFFAGFLFTAGPRWLHRPPVEARVLVACLLPQLAGWLVFMLSVHGRDAAFGQTLGALGLAAVGLGWWRMLRRFAAMVLASESDDKAHAIVVAVACTVGACALAAVAWGVARQDVLAIRAAVQMGLWGFVGLVFAAVAHRMIPFFSAAVVPRLDAWRPLWLLWAFVATFAWQAVAATAEALGVVQGRPWALARAVVELGTGIGCLALALRWGLVQSLRIRLLAMLHIGFTWLGVSLVLYGTEHAVEAAGGPAAVLGAAPVHAFTLGYLASNLLAMVTRVSCGHGGRTLAADDFIWRLFWCLQAAIAIRLLAAVAMQVDVGWGVALVCLSAVGWAAVCWAWSLRHGHWFGTPRPDGRPG
jgi:uncharacterized protein involved in response to NO